jgi:uncharacterized membrane protein
MKSLLYQPILIIHIIAGFLALVTGLIAMVVRKKGGKLHNRTGIVFYWSMFVVFISAIIFFVLDPLSLKYQFFLTIGIVSFYPAWSGKRVLKMKKSVTPKWYDTTAAFAIGISGIIMVAYGIYGFTGNINFQGLEILFLIFGGLSLANAYGDLKIYLGFKEAGKMHWFFAHAGKMTGAYSAAVTAFCVNVVPRYLPDGTPTFVFVLTWVLPGVILGIAGARISKHYRKKFKMVKTKNERKMPEIAIA